MGKAQASVDAADAKIECHFILLVYMITLLNVCFVLFFIIYVLIAVFGNCIANKHAILIQIKLLRMSLLSLSLLSF